MMAFDAFPFGLQLATWNKQHATVLSKDGFMLLDGQRRTALPGVQRALDFSVQQLFDHRDSESSSE